MSSWSSLYAHTRINPATGQPAPQSEWQTLEEHARNVAEMAADFAKPFASSDAARLIGMVHDAGKARPNFQNYLCGKRGPHNPHAFAGAAWLDKNVSTIGLPLAYTVAGHHAGLPDGTGGATSLSSHISVEATNNSPVEVPGSKPQKPDALVPDWVKQGANKKVALWIRMLFSCLVDADWLDTEHFMAPERANRRLEEFDSLDTLWSRYQAFMDKIQTNAPDTPVNRIRKNILENTLNHAQDRKGFFSMTVPTGGGKTLASLGFALKHAREHGLRKIIYVIPYSTIIEQTTDVLQGVFGESDENPRNVLEHHAEAAWREDDGVSASALRQLTENWAGVPVVVTTNVQFFESFFSAEPSRCRKLHNVAESVIILDEAQKLPEKLFSSARPPSRTCNPSVSPRIAYKKLPPTRPSSTQTSGVWIITIWDPSKTGKPWLTTWPHSHLPFAWSTPAKTHTTCLRKSGNTKAMPSSISAHGCVPNIGAMSSPSSAIA